MTVGIPDISIIIVNWNVRDFLQKCLASIYNYTQGIKFEVWVVDNNSSDASCAMVREMFPQVNLISNQVNLGFAAANNLALKECQAEFLLS